MRFATAEQSLPMRWQRIRWVSREDASQYSTQTFPLCTLVKTTKTASRDLNALRELDLVTITGNIVTANVELLSQLLPSRALLN